MDDTDTFNFPEGCAKLGILDGGFKLLVRAIGAFGPLPREMGSRPLGLSLDCERAHPAGNDNSWAPSPPPENIV
jgi:hypothetical protein